MIARQVRLDPIRRPTVHRVITYPGRNEPAPGDWTVDDLCELPDDRRRRELIDGVLFASALRTSFHQTLLMRLVFELDRMCPPDYAATHGMEIRISRRTALIADGLVVTATHDQRVSHINPSDVLIAIEVVSPGSVTMDRITKPALYAQAGIPFYWRIETQDTVSIATHRLDVDAEVYIGSGVHTDDFTFDEPFPLSLSPRALSRRPNAPSSP